MWIGLLTALQRFLVTCSNANHAPMISKMPFWCSKVVTQIKCNYFQGGLRRCSSGVCGGGFTMETPKQVPLQIQKEQCQHRPKKALLRQIEALLCLVNLSRHSSPPLSIATPPRVFSRNQRAKLLALLHSSNLSASFLLYPKIKSGCQTWTVLCGKTLKSSVPQLEMLQWQKRIGSIPSNLIKLAFVVFIVHLLRKVLVVRLYHILILSAASTSR
mmetsp:Transcript_13012/g.26468  ORF Transcript_13012/g.26468 Transcript_13012/m.26468 type:complete len:215 (+) Transcript_13012:447-1091(+)